MRANAGRRVASYFWKKVDKLIPWKRLEPRIKRHYIRNKTSRPAHPLKVMLRLRCLQEIYNYSDIAMEDALYEIESLRRFSDLRLSERVPDEATILNFRHLLETHGLGQTLFDEINTHLSEKGYLLR